MSIGINIFPLIPGKNGGAEQFIVRMLDALHGAESPFEFIVFTSPHNEHLFAFEKPHMRKVVIPLNVAQYKKHEQEFLVEIQKHSIDFLHYPQSTIFPLSIPWPCVLTVFDIQHEYYADFFSAEILKLRCHAYRLSALKADRIIAISHFTKKTITDKYGISDDSIDVIYPFMEQCKEVNVGESWMSVKEELNLPEDYIIYPAGSWQHKNHINLFKALTHLRKKGLIVPLVLTGISDSFETNIDIEIHRLNLETQVYRLGYLEEMVFRIVLGHSRVLVYPSLFEGFGMPLIEAMIASVPVVCSDKSCLPEVASGAALLFDPDDYLDIAKKVEMVWSSEILRQNLVVKGLQRHKQLCKQNRVTKLLDVYHKMYSMVAAGKGSTETLNEASRIN